MALPRSEAAPTPAHLKEKIPARLLSAAGHVGLIDYLRLRFKDERCQGDEPGQIMQMMSFIQEEQKGNGEHPTQLGDELTLQVGGPLKGPGGFWPECH